jgi:hypothetical protein
VPAVVMRDVRADLHREVSEWRSHEHRAGNGAVRGRLRWWIDARPAA